MVFTSVIVSASVLGVLGDVYCPTQADFDYDGNIQWHGNGYTMTGEGGIHGKTTFNLLGGYVEFDFDTSNAHAAVNTNLYTISPTGTPGVENYCDIQDNGHGYMCMEMDVIESNGNCMSQATWHTWQNHDGDCDQGGCWGKQRTSGRFTVRAEFSHDGFMDVSYNGQKNSFNPTPSSSAMAYVVETMQSTGASLESSQWVGWVPGASECPGGGDVHSSLFTLSNLRVSGTVVQGMQPTKCGPSPTPSPTPSPVPTPSPAPSSGMCCWGDLCDHHDPWCDNSAGNCASCSGQWRQGSAGVCCWGGCGGTCDHHDAFCDSSGDNCGQCSGQWCYKLSNASLPILV